MKTAQDSYPEQVERASEKSTALFLKIDAILLITMPALSSVLFKVMNFSRTMDFWGCIFLVYAVAFAVYGARNRCGKADQEEPEDEEEEQLLEKDCGLEGGKE